MDWNLFFDLSLWPLLFWASLVYLVIVLVSRPTRSKGGRTGGSSGRSVRDHLLGRSWIGPVVGAIVLIGSLGFILGSALTAKDWTEEEVADAEHFIESVALYGEASTLSQKKPNSREDWESVNALMQASMAEAEQVSDQMLEYIDPDLPAMWKEKFIPGLRIGTYGLRYYTALPQKGKDTVEHYRDDSLKQSRVLLEEWNSWFSINKEKLISRLE